MAEVSALLEEIAGRTCFFVLSSTVRSSMELQWMEGSSFKISKK